MSSNETLYTVRVHIIDEPTGRDDSTEEWVALTELQANHIYNEQVKIHGEDKTLLETFTPPGR